jgi:hypothetical protein
MREGGCFLEQDEAAAKALRWNAFKYRGVIVTILLCRNFGLERFKDGTKKLFVKSAR